jgi:hypothetical protein
MTKPATVTSQYLDGTVFAQYYPLIQEETPFRVFGAHPDHIAQERKHFIESGYKYLPNLLPTELDAEQLAIAQHGLTALKRQLPTSAPDPNVRRAYHWRINEDLANINMVLAAARRHTSKFRGYNLFLYGAPRKDIFGAVCDWFVCDAEKAHNDPRATVVAAAAKVTKALRRSRGDREFLIPNPEVFHAARKHEYAVGGFMYRLLQGIEFPPSGTITEQGGDKILRQMLKNLHCQQTLEDAAAWSVTPTALRRPIAYSMPTQDFIEYVSHEFRHIIEYQDGLSTRLELTSTGLDHYSLENEGRGVVTEEITNKTFQAFTKRRRWYELLGRHLTVSLSCGIDGQHRDFSQVYDIIKSVLLVYESARSDVPNNIDAIVQKADDQAWDLLLSVYEGTDGSGRGGGWRRPMIYLEGSVDLWQAETKHSGAIEIGDLGKFDIDNPRHVKLLEAAGILDPSLHFTSRN